MSAPCRGCGVATTGPVTRRFTSSGGLPTPHRDYEVGTCADCLTLDFDRPGVAVRAALRLLRKRESDDVLAADVFIEADLDVSVLMYESAYRPEPQRKPWAHVPKEHKALLSKAYVGVLDARIHAASDHDRPIPPTAPPSGPAACVACGVGTSAKWYSVHTHAFTHGPDYLDGHVCATCAAVYETVGALGQPFLEKAVMEAKGLSWSETSRIPGLRAWIATGRKPGEPWAWLRVSEAAPRLDPLTELQLKVADLELQVTDLRAEQDALRSMDSLL